MDAKARLLVVEDSRTQAVHIKYLLERADYAVDLAENGREGLEKVRQDQPDMVVTDLEMPEMNGLELVAALHQEYPTIPVVLITARGSEEIAAKALREGAASYVPKREMVSDLVPTLDRILAVIRVRRGDERIGTCISRTETDYLLENDNGLVPFVIARIQDILQQLQICDDSKSMQVATALDEALVNAIIHGNLEVSSALAIDDGESYSVQIEERRRRSPFKDRKVQVRVQANRERAVIAIRDEGPGFDPASLPDPTAPENLEKVSGRGLMLINAFMDSVSHNENGTEITMIKRKPEDTKSED